jgi:RNA polymerase sigma-70 factor (ECF subfamily)
MKALVSSKPREVGLRKAKEPDDPRSVSDLLLKDEDLVAQAQKGKQSALDELVNRYQKRAYAIAYHLCSDEEKDEADDLTQEAFLKAFKGLGNFRGDSSFSTWFYRIVVNVCLDWRRRRQRWGRIFSPWRRAQNDNDPSGTVQKQEPDPEADLDPGALLRGKELSNQIRKSLNSLPEKQRTAFQLKVLHGMSIREIAQVMGTAEGTIKSHLFRATSFLQEALKEYEGS